MAADSARHQVVPRRGQINGGFLVLWGDNRAGSYHVYDERMADNGSVTDPNGFLVTGNRGGSLAVTKGGGGNWATSYGRRGNIFFATIAPKQPTPV